MWHKREQKNRRRNRGHVLDVKVRSNQARAARVRLASLAFGVMFGTVFGLYVFWRAGEWALEKFVYQNASFAIQKIEVRTDGVIAPDQLRHWANVRSGQNLIALNLASVKRNLEIVSTIASVSVERVLPHTLKIQVRERVPVAQVDLPADGEAGQIAVAVLLLDANGFVMKPVDPRQCLVPLSRLNTQLPVVTGLNFNQLQPGRQVKTPQVAAALSLICAFNTSPMGGLVDLRRVDVASPGVVVATTAQGSQITFALGGLDQQLARLRAIYDLGRSMNRVIASADLAVTNNVPVRWTTASAVPSVAPRKTAPMRTGRRNV